jgi:hypothetical protein
MILATWCLATTLSGWLTVGVCPTIRAEACHPTSRLTSSQNWASSIIGRKKIQPASREIRAFYERAPEALKFQLLRFTADELHAIATAVADAVARYCYTCYACAIMLDTSICVFASTVSSLKK